jgi:uncharacterized BrkB/YihY/UPF0761 family membrane protein
MVRFLCRNKSKIYITKKYQSAAAPAAAAAPPPAAATTIIITANTAIFECKHRGARVRALFCSIGRVGAFVFVVFVVLFVHRAIRVHGTGSRDFLFGGLVAHVGRGLVVVVVAIVVAAYRIRSSRRIHVDFVAVFVSAFEAFANETTVVASVSIRYPRW